MRSIACILTGLALIVLALLVEPYVRPVEGFQTQSAPAGLVTIRGLAIKASIQQIAEKLPFIYSEFESIDTLDVTQNPPVETGRSVPIVPTFSNTTPNIYYFKLKEPVTLALTDEMIQMINNASRDILGSENLLAFWVTIPGGNVGTLYPTITPLATTNAASTGTASTGTTPTDTTSTASTGTTPTDTTSTASTGTPAV